MKSWENLEADIDLIMNKHFTSGRGGHAIRKIVLHHNAGTLSVKGCWDTWQTREASAHYQVQKDGVIGQLVWDRDTAWHAGSVNKESIGIEHANDRAEPWTISEATLENGAHLVAAICKHYKLGRPQWGVNVFGHKTFMATVCPGEISGSQNAQYMARAQYWYDQMTGSKPATPATAPDATASASVGKSVDQLASEVLQGKYGNGEARKKALGAKYEVVQAIVNDRLGYNPHLERLAALVWKGHFGNGQNRKNALGSLYEPVQKLVNEGVGK